MERPLVKALLWAFVVFLQIQEFRGCFEEERIALLKLNAVLVSNTPANDHLPLWSDDANSDCCGWARVTCNSTTGRIIELSLSQIKLVTGFEERWLLNVSLFMPFTELTSLDLSWNEIGGCLPNEGFEKLSNLKDLKILNLGYNYLDDNSILQSLVEATSLETLNLTYNNLNGHFSTQGSKSLSRLKNLETLDLSFNSFNRSIIESLSSAKSIKNLNLARNSMHGSFSTQGSKSMSRLKNLETLDLSSNNFNTSIIESLSSTKSIKNLNLGQNWMHGSFSTQGSKSMSRLKNLETLDLSSNNFNTSIIESLSSTKSIKNLNLGQNWMHGSFSTQELSNLENLEILDLSHNSLSGFSILQGLANLSRLEILDLHDNYFTGSISLHFGALSSLKAISLANNSFNGTLPRELCGLATLEVLDLSSNLFEGILPPCIKNLTSLEILDISRNQFSGDISSISVATPKSIMYICLIANHFEGIFSLSSFANHSKLEVISLSSDKNNFEVETENPMGWNPLFQLRAVLLPNCSMNKLTGNVPSFLFNQHKVKEIDLSHNQLKGSFPIWLLEKNIGLQRLNLQNNSFTGKFYLPIGHNLKLSRIDVSNNHLDGKFQEDIGELTTLEYLNLSRNCFKGYLPPSITKACQLWMLDLSFNNFSGELPKGWDRNCNCSKLFFLKLSNNQFNGTIPQSLFEIPQLYFDLSNNKMSGPIPVFTSIQSLLLRNNSFEGQVPCDLPATMLDLSYNSLSGLLPSCLNLQYVEHLLLQGNKLTGSLPKSIFNSSSLLTLDLSNNNLNGSLPDEMGELSNLRMLLLRGNNFSGIIPNELCWLKNIYIMDISENLLFGSIPECFHNISFGKLHTSDDYIYGRKLSYGTLTTTEVVLSKRIQNWVIRMDDDEAETIYGAEQVSFGFTTKHRLDSYSGGILNYMSGLDLSCNKLIGIIPPQLTELSSIHALNLSHNQLSGSILESFSNLVYLESLDLSHNNLSGELPSALTNMNFLEVFSVAHNNLSGKVPEMKAQFATFDKSSYEGNPFLCGEPLENNCPMKNELHPSPTKSSHTIEDKWYKVDLQVFYPSFFATYIIFFLAVTTLLYINPHWQQQCFHMIEDFKYWCCYHVFNILKKILNRLYH